MKTFGRTLASDFILHGKIETTLYQAKAVRSIIEKLAHFARQNSLSSRRRLQSFLQNRSIVNKLLNQIKGSSRTSGFTRLIHTSIRRGDSARLSRLEWVDAPSPKSPKSLPYSTHPTHKTHKP